MAPQILAAVLCFAPPATGQKETDDYCVCRTMGRRFFAACLPHDPTAASVIRYCSRLYNITRIDTFERYREDLTLYCSRRARK